VAQVLHERSAGGALLVPFGRTLLVALIELRRGTVLALPKGHIEAGEESAEAACRETREETGLTGAVVAPLKEISYRFYSRHRRARIAKRVFFYLLVYRAGSPAHHNTEVEGVRLVPLATAAALLAYQGEREVVREAEARLRALAGSGPGNASDGAVPEPLLDAGGLLCTR
jgi:8-oxo-dGTP pyrophosphatase MutT (NUDIX family)